MATPEEPRGAAPDRQMPRRQSSYVDRAELAGVAARERLDDLLRVHDGPEAQVKLDQFGSDELPLLRRIAATAASDADDPLVRHHAIAALGRVGGRDDHNLLVEMARTDPDPAIRASALTSLSSTGLLLAATVLRDALGSRDVVERIAAEKGVRRLVLETGPDAVIEASRAGSRSARRAANFEDLVRGVDRPDTRSARKRSSRTSGDS